MLGHCTGRLIEGERGLRPQSVFDPEVVFEACRTFDVAVEINSRPERRDPPTRLLSMAIEMGCLFSIDTDAHAPGQLEFVAYGCERAEDLGLDPDRVINTWPVDTLLGVDPGEALNAPGRAPMCISRTRTSSFGSLDGASFRNRLICCTAAGVSRAIAAGVR